MEYKLCTYCGENKSIDRFGTFLNSKKERIQKNKCKDCINLDCLRNRETKRMLNILKDKQDNTNKEKRICSKCKIEKEISDFYISKGNIKTQCKICHNKFRKKQDNKVSFNILMGRD